MAEDSARSRIAYLVVIGYLAVLALNIVPVSIYIVTHGLAPGDVKDLATTMAAIVSSVTGVLGFVLGYYFKSAESGVPRPRSRRSTPPAKNPSP